MPPTEQDLADFLQRYPRLARLSPRQQRLAWHAAKGYARFQAVLTPAEQTAVALITSLFLLGLLARLVSR